MCRFPGRLSWRLSARPLVALRAGWRPSYTAGVPGNPVSGRALVMDAHTPPSDVPNPDTEGVSGQNSVPEPDPRDTIRAPSTDDPEVDGSSSVNELISYRQARAHERWACDTHWLPVATARVPCNVPPEDEAEKRTEEGGLWRPRRVTRVLALSGLQARPPVAHHRSGGCVGSHPRRAEQASAERH